MSLRDRPAQDLLRIVPRDGQFLREGLHAEDARCVRESGHMGERGVALSQATGTMKERESGDEQGDGA